MFKALAKMIVSQQEELKFAELLMAARSGDPDAMYQIGNAYECGKYGKKVNVEMADYWLKKAALSRNSSTRKPE